LAPRVILGNPAHLEQALLECFRDAERAARGRGRPLSVALTGGASASAFFPALAVALDPARIELFWADERAVPPQHPDSNYRLAHELWLGPSGVKSERIHRMPAEAPDLDRAAAEYQKTLLDRLGSPPRLDLALLGVGLDGHVCSLFPGHPLLAERERFVASVSDSPKPPSRRMTLTLPALWAARKLVLVALGAEKATLVDTLLSDPDSALPTAQAARGARDAVILGDGSA
jgi:6-phosphogluconolactonase